MIGDITHGQVNGTLLSASLVALYTIPANCVALFFGSNLCNIDPSTIYFAEIQIVESGGSTGDAKKVASNQSANGIRPGERRPYNFPILLGGTAIWGKADVANKISFRAGYTLKQVSA